MEITSNQKFIHTSPRKLRLVADLVRALSPNRALDVLEFTPKSAARELSNAIKTALANAKQKGLVAEGLVFEKLEVNESLKMRRMKAGTRGRVKPFKRRMSHIKIVLSDNSKVNLPASRQEVQSSRIEAKKLLENKNSEKKEVVDAKKVKK